MSTKNPEESIVKIEEDGEVKELYLAANPFGNFVVEFGKISAEIIYLSFLKSHSYTFIDFNGYECSNLKAKKALSYRILSEIETPKPKTFEFTQMQSDLITSKNKLSWSVAVSDKLYKHESRQSTARLLAISCISKDDMTYMTYGKPQNRKKITGFTIVFFINHDNLIEETLTLDNHGGQVKLFSKYEDKESSQNADEKNIDEDNQKRKTNGAEQNLDRFFLIILNVSGVHKYYIKHFFKHLNKLTGKIRSFEYPKRINHALKKNIRFSPQFNHKYIQKCLNLHYFLVDTTCEAYASGYNVKLYLIDCGLEIASIKLINNVKVSADYNYDYFMHFFNDDESLLIYQSKHHWAIWNFFGLEQKSIELKDHKIEHQLEFDLKMKSIFTKNCYQLERSNSFVIIVKNKEEKEETKFSKDRYISDGFISDYLKSESVNPNFKTLSLKESFVETTIEKEKHFIFDIDHKKSELDEYYQIFEPWLYTSDDDVKGSPRYSVYLDEKNETLLLIGTQTIQVWHDRAKQDQTKQDQAKQDQAKQDQAKQGQDKKRTLEFISVIDKKDTKNVIIEKIEYAIRKFKISFQDSKTQDSKKVIEMGCDDDIIHTVIEACNTLRFLNSIYHGSNIDYSISLAFKDCHSKFNEIVEQTRNIIIRFIQLYPIVWRLLSVRYDLLSILIAEEKLLIKHILFNEKKDIYSHEDCIRKTLDIVYELKNENSNDKMPIRDHLLHEKSIHMPQYSSWFGGENPIRRSFDLKKDLIYLGYLLEYYSNKAVEDIGWMISIRDILQELYDCDYGMIKLYLQILLYKPCFCSKGLDIPYFDFLTIPPSVSNSLEVYIPITQLIPLDSDLKVEEISKEKISDVKMGPFVDFVANYKKEFKLKGNKFTNFLKSLIFPKKYLPLEEIPIPIFFIIESVGSDDPFYFNPSMEAIMNFLCHVSKSYWRNTFYIFIIYFLSYSIITWMYVAHMEVTGVLQHMLMFVTLILLFYLTYYHLMVEFNLMLKQEIYTYFRDPFNYVDLFSLILPFIISVYILIEYFTIEDGFKYAESNIYLSFIIFISIIVICFPYIGLSDPPTTSVVMNGSTVAYNMTGEAPENLFSNPFTAIISAYNWDSIALDTWGFWPLAIINVLGNIFFIILLQNVMISFMSAVFESAGKRNVIYFQSILIYECARLKDSAFTSGRNYFDKRLKNKLKVKYVCFYDNPSITEAWRDKAKKWESTPIYWNAESQISTENDCKYFMEHEDIGFIWRSE
ncbi:hypothetical protein C2G38_2057139 [Gigaspora rosea]|uniref:Ion transport domain-containing protein n=1 Tax=Gigaspora rosea TaxID=44941 RepID=A0A397W4T3_9GLOM|nr:hypothetical protein C2G38_2057139 [Gigaspora rosea]